MKSLTALLLGSLTTYLLMRRALREKQQANVLLRDMAHVTWQHYQEALSNSL